MRMTEAEFQNERRYQTMMYFAKTLLRDGAITEEEFCEIETKYCLMFSPKTGSLLTQIDLLCARKRGINGSGKEESEHGKNKCT